MKTADELPYHVVIRHSLATGDVMVIFSLGSKFKALQANIMTAFSGSSRITSLWLNLNDSPETSVLSDTFLHLSGTETLSDSLDGISFPVSPQSFVQNNPVMTAKLYDYVRGILRHISAKTVWDLYCGIGTLTQVCAQEVTDIVGIEVIPQAVSDAQVSSKKNNISNIRFYCEDATEFVSNADNDESPDTVILDPPRRGCSSALLTTLADKKIAHIVYISCSPQSLGRDVQALIDMGYSVKSCVGFDCFPNTIHVESVTHLVLKK
jgi:23S rRNA (uracil1939-C5)-methyltransferase